MGCSLSSVLVISRDRKSASDFDNRSLQSLCVVFIAFSTRRNELVDTAEETPAHVGLMRRPRCYVSFRRNRQKLPVSQSSGQTFYGRIETSQPA